MGVSVSGAWRICWSRGRKTQRGRTFEAHNVVAAVGEQTVRHAHNARHVHEARLRARVANKFRGQSSLMTHDPPA